MTILKKALRMLEKYPLCNHCLGRQFALLGYDLENNERGRAIKTTLVLEAHKLAFSTKGEGLETLNFLATNGFSKTASRILYPSQKHASPRSTSPTCFLCEDAFTTMDNLKEKALEKLEKYEYNNFLVGVQLPFAFEERDDEFKSEFDVRHGENLRNEFGRVIGKKISKTTGKTVEYQKPEIVVLINPMKDKVRLQVNPLYILGRYRKLVRGIPQSPWLCSNCQGEGCKNCDWTGQMYSESVAEMIEKPFLDKTEGVDLVFHASGREDVDARMLGKGRPFVTEIKNPRKRFLNLEKLEDHVNTYADGKIEVLNLKFADKDDIDNLKKAESALKEYLVTIELKNKVTPRDLEILKEKLTNVSVKQRTPRRVLHRSSDLVREKYIYRVKLKKLSAKKVKMKVRCQGGLYVKELVTGDGDRTIPSVSQIIEKEAKPLTLDVLNVIMEGVRND